MIVAGQRLPILIATKPVDFRCGHQALALIVQTELKLDPHSGVTVIFRSKRGDRLKILVWDDEPCRAIGPSDNGEWDGDDLQGAGTGQLCLAQGSGWHDAGVAGAV
ncbi:MAG: IS66 family insertion sequence element accessory protein TnpB [Rhodobacter sp.]|nr:IS66 family insertion sequence element accessory protein TnpB [Phenylobacterium sp.]MCA3513819.1 IS66 family insertion sequence element accessory protein TnpB [Rhodobacter sp.]MCA3536223.1 IS66 family insertion sequence element accessory protein TnpB [Rhodobacter sp.]MCA3550341.1 IS66 family insertion sequence element accessory protein TnpB [Rhodobacter sp.]MCA6264432.1 IS66 family insertion sequence element accessory protein TnpB [Phenylobacterium sp.]